MDDLTRNFPNCTLSVEEIRDTIRKVLRLEEGYFCYKCFKLLSLDTMPKDAELCKLCYQFYCKDCSKLFYPEPTVREISPYKCIQCSETRRFYPLK